jgi:hypothetical protein
VKRLLVSTPIVVASLLFGACSTKTNVAPPRDSAIAATEVSQDTLVADSASVNVSEVENAGDSVGPATSDDTAAMGSSAGEPSGETGATGESTASANEIAAPAFAPPGMIDLIRQRKIDVCPLLTAKEIEKTYAPKTPSTSVSYSRANLGSDASLARVTCSIIFNDEQSATGGSSYMTYGLSASPFSEWATDGDGVSVEDATVLGKRARWVKKRDDIQAELILLVELESSPPRSAEISVDGLAGWDDHKKLQPLAELFVEKVLALKVAPQPPLDTKVPTPFDLSDAQICGLISGDFVRSLINDGASPGDNTLLAQDDSISCGKGDSRVNLEIAKRNIVLLDETNVSDISIGDRKGKMQVTPTYGEGAKTSSIDVWVQVNENLSVALKTQNVLDSPERRLLIASELTRIMEQLKTLGAIK